MQRGVISEVKCNTNTWSASNTSQDKEDKTMHVNGRAAAKDIKSYQTSAVTLSSWSLLQTCTLTLQHSRFFSDELESCSSPLFPRKPRYWEACDFKAISTALRYCTEMAGRLAFKVYYKNPQQPAYSKDIMWRRPSVSRAKLNKNGCCGKTKYSSNKQA